MKKVPKLAIVVDGSLPRENPPVNVDAVVPFWVNFSIFRGSRWVKESRSQEEFTQVEFFRIQEDSKDLPTTSQPNSEDFLRTFLTLEEEGFEQILVLVVPESKSGTFVSAVRAKERLENEYPRSKIEIEVFDTGITASGVEFMAEVAIKARDEGEPLAEILDKLNGLRPKIELFLALDTIRYLGASGRVDSLADHRIKETMRRYMRHWGSRLVSILGKSPKLLVLFREGEERSISFSRHFESVVDNMFREIRHRVNEEGKRIRRVYVLHSRAPDQASRLVRRLREFHDGEISERQVIPLALLSITGPTLVAAFCVYE